MNFTLAGDIQTNCLHHENVYCYTVILSDWNIQTAVILFLVSCRSFVLIRAY